MKRATFMVLWWALVWAPASAEPNVIVARTSPDVVLIWRVNDAVGTELAKHPAQNALRDSMLELALEVMRRNVPSDAAPTATATVKLVYFSSGGYDTNYRIATVSGVRRVGEVTTSVAGLRRNAPHWRTELMHGRVPPQLAVRFEPGAFDGLNAAP